MNIFFFFLQKKLGERIFKISSLNMLQIDKVNDGSRERAMYVVRGRKRNVENLLLLQQWTNDWTGGNETFSR